MGSSPAAVELPSSAPAATPPASALHGVPSDGGAVAAAESAVAEEVVSVVDTMLPADIDPLHDFIAGTFAGISLTLVGHPFDTVKVRLQTQSSGSGPMYRGGLDCLRQTVTKEGLFAVYKGMSGPMLTIPVINAIVFSAYAQAKDFMHRMQSTPEPLTLTQISLAGGYAGLLNCVVATPTELIKTRLQIQHELMTLHHTSHTLHVPGGLEVGLHGRFFPARILPAEVGPSNPEHIFFRGPLDCIRAIYSKRGVKGLFRGMSATIYREIPGYASQFFAYEALKRILTREGEHVSDLGTVPLIIAGGCAGIFGWVWSYPMDFIKSQIQAEPYHLPTTYRKNPYLLDGGFWNCAKQTVDRGGYRALWKGFGTCAARAFPANAAGFLAYEYCLAKVKGIEILSTAKWRE